MADKYYQALGRRKTSIAQVRLTPGTGKITVNDKPIEKYFVTASMRQTVLGPLQEVGKVESADISAKVVGGGLVGQSDAVRLAIARALVKMDEVYKTSVKTKGLLTRDPRKKERKKFGHRGARRSTQWRKR